MGIFFQMSEGPEASRPSVLPFVFICDGTERLYGVTFC